MERKFYTVNQVAELLQLNPQTIYNWLYTKGFPHVKLGKIVRIPKDEFEEWLEEHKRGIREGEFLYDSLGRIRPRFYNK